MPKKRALLVGINYPGTSHALNGCVNDVITMNEMITNKFGFTDVKEKRMLTDASATTANIVDRLQWLVYGAQPGDVLFFHYSGHGSQLIDSDYDDGVGEPDGLDEIICPIDLDWREKVIKDDDFRKIFATVPAGVNLTVVLDCCHSGTGLRGGLVNPYVPQANDSGPNKSRLLPMPPDIANRGFGKDLKPKSRNLQADKEMSDQTGLLVSGCRADQTSADAWIHNKYMGACTYYLVDTVKRFAYNIDYTKLVRVLNYQLTKWGYTQRPELNGSSALFGKKFLKPFV